MLKSQGSVKTHHKNAAPHPGADLCRLILSLVTQFQPEGSSQSWEGLAEPLSAWPGQQHHHPHLPTFPGDPQDVGNVLCDTRTCPFPPCSKPFSSSSCTTHPGAGKKLLLCALWISRSVHPLATFPPCCESRLKSDCWEEGKVKV